MRVIEIEPGNSLVIYGALREDEEAVLRSCFLGLGGFCAYKVRGAYGVFSPSGFNTVETRCGAPRTFDHRLRPAQTLLRLLGRVPVPHDDRTMLSEVPTVFLREAVSSQAKAFPHKMVSINAESMRETLTAGIPEAAGDANAERNPLKVFGNKTFSLSLGEAHDLEQSGRLVCDPAVCPTGFYRSLFKQTAQRLPYYSNRRTVPLCDVGTPDSTRELVVMQEAAVRRSAEHVVQMEGRRPPALTPESTLAEARAFEDWAWDANQVRGRKVQAEQAVKYAHAEDEDESHQQWVKSILASPTAFGFDDGDAAVRTLNLSLNELSSSLCLSQKGYFMVSGEGTAENQLCEKTPVPTTFLSAAGLDFCTDVSTLVEGAKYFTTNPAWKPSDPLRTKFEAFREGGEELLCRRVLELYKSIFRAAELQCVSHPCVLPLGLGVFLGNVPEPCKDAVRRAYFKAQVDLLRQRDWGFKVYIMNAGPPALVKFFKDLLDSEDLTGLHCPIVMHSRDVKFVTVALAKRGVASAYLNPSDAVAVMLGALGYFWETGKGSRYVGEEDFVATSTAALSHAQVSDVYTDPERVVSS